MRLFQVVNNGVINVNVNVGTLDPEANRHTDQQLVNALLSAEPEFKRRFRFAVGVKSSNSNGIFYCRPENNQWRPLHNHLVEKELVNAFTAIDTLTTQDRRHVESRRGGADLVHILTREVANIAP